MGYIEFYNFLDGKNLCNIFANLIVKKINEELPDAKTDISVVNVRNFFIVKGVTTYNEPLNLAELLQSFLKQFDGELSNKVRVIDSILYNKELDQEPLNLNLSFDKTIEKINESLKEELNQYTKEKIYFTLIKSDFSQEIYVSEKIYGLSNEMRLYYFLLRSIKNHVFKLGLGKRMTISLYSDVNINKMDNLNVILKLTNDDYIVKTDWLESLILDVFPFEFKKLKDIFKDNYCLENEILGVETNYSFNKLTYINDFVLV